MTSEAPSPFEVIVVPFPYSERLAEKRRPALVISGLKLHALGFVWIAMITGGGKEGRVGDVEIEDISAAGLPGPSVVRASKIATIEPSRIVRIAGMLAPAERPPVLKAIERFLATR